MCSIKEAWLHGRSLRYQHGRFGTQAALRSAWSRPFLLSALPEGRVLDATGFFAALLHHARDSIIVICQTGPARWRYCPRRKRPRGAKVISRSSNGSGSGKTKGIITGEAGRTGAGRGRSACRTGAVIARSGGCVFDT